MGSNNLHHKRKARKAVSLQRQKAKRSAYDRILIVSEGQKTEPNYFMELRDAFGLNPHNIIIIGRGTDPLSVVKFALKEYRNNKDYNRLYCVFDKDQHTTYQAALDKIKSTRLASGDTIHAITSVPCFEFWLLLHFIYTVQPFHATGKKSICDQVIVKLKHKNRLPDYQKGDANLFEQIKDKLEKAKERAKRVRQHNQATGTDNPSTQVDELVEYLQKLKK